MRVLLFLAVFALATQVHMNEVTEFYRTFVNNIPMDVETKNRVMNDGLDCINQAINTLANSIQNIQYDVQAKDFVSTLREVISSVQVLEHTVLPKCALTYMELTSYLQAHQNHSALTSSSKVQLFEGRLIQLVAKTVVDVLNKQPNAAAKDLATFVSTGFGLIDAQLPTILEFNYTQYVDMDEKKFVPQFLKGFFTGIGITDLAKINATSQCVLDVFNSIKTVATNPAVQRGDFYTRANAFMDSIMTVTDSFERCKKLDMVDTVVFQRLIQMFTQYPALSILRVWSNTLLEFPTIQASQINMNVYVLQGQYELAGRLYAMNLRTIYNGIMF